MQLEISTPAVANLPAILLDFHLEEVAEELEVKPRAEEALIEHDEVGDVKNGVWCQAMQLTPIKIQKPMHKVVQRE